MDIVNFLQAFFIGIIVSFLSGIPVGPVNMAVIRSTLNFGKVAGYFVGFGALAVELVYCSIATFGFSFLISNDFIFRTLNLLTIPVLFILGIITIRNRNKHHVAVGDVPNAFKKRNKILIGATLCISNPVLLVYWLGVVAFLQSQGFLENKAESLIPFLVGVAGGILLLISLLVLLTLKHKEKIRPEVKSKMNLWLGIFFIGFAIYLGGKYLIKTFPGTLPF